MSGIIPGPSGGSIPQKFAAARVASDGTLEDGSTGVTSVSAPSGFGEYTIDITDAGFTEIPNCSVAPIGLLAGAFPGFTISYNPVSATSIVIQITDGDASGRPHAFSFVCVGI
jgi:hypothetical protein